MTRHIPPELKASDWDLMILHYLGLDHIGHLANPFSPLVGPKLQEMDRVVEMVMEGLNKVTILRFHVGFHCLFFFFQFFVF